MFKKIMDNKRERLFTGFGSMGLSVSLGLTVWACLSVCVCVCVCVCVGVWIFPFLCVCVSTDCVVCEYGHVPFSVFLCL